MYQIISLLLMAMMVLSDRLTKVAAVDSSLVSGAEIVLIPKVLQLRYVENTGAAFSIFEGKTLFLSIFTAVILLIGIYLILSKKFKSKVVNVSVLLLVGGGIGNLIDRVANGYVVDYFEFLFVDFAVFNLADCFITVGEAILVAYLIFDIINGERKKKKVAVAELETDD